MKSSNYKLKIIAIICFSFITISEFIAFTNPAKGYESSIYVQTPTSVWVFLIGSMISGVTIIVHQAVIKGYKNNKFWLIGLLITILAQETLFYLPYIRGYLPWEGADTTKHIVLVTGILSSGHFTNENFYPVTHILLSEAILITGIQKLTVVIFSGFFLLITYVFSIYLLSTTVLPKMEQQLLAVAATAGMAYSFNIYTSAIFPVYWSVVLIPFLLSFFFKRSTLSYNILFVVFLVLYPFFHVFSSFVIIIALVIIGLSKMGYIYIARSEKNVTSLFNFKFSPTPLLIESAILISWILSFQVFNNNLRFIWSQITIGKGTNVLSGMGTRLDKVNVHGIHFVQLLIQIYGTMIIFIVLSLVAMLILIKQVRSGDAKNEKQNLFSLLCVYFFLYFLYLLYLLGAPGLSAIAGNRMLYIAPLLSPIFAGFCLHELFKNVHSRYLASKCIICVIMLSSVLTIFSYFHSPYILTPNNQVTMMDMKGMTWFIEQKNTSIGHVYIGTYPGKFVITVLGDIGAHKRPDMFDSYDYSIGEFIPDHFNYTNHSSLGESYVGDKYSAITKYDRLLYEKVWKEVGRFNSTDFEKLEYDTSVDKLYSNSELDVYLIHGIRPKMASI